MIASREVEIPLCRGVGRQRGRGFGALAQVIGKLQVHFCVNISSQLQNAYVLTCWNFLCQKFPRFLAVERFSTQLQRVWEDRLGENSWVMVAAGGRQVEGRGREP